MAGSVADDDVAKAVEAKWNADALLPTLVPGGLHQGRQVAAVTATTPYAVLEVKQGPRANEYSTGGFYIDYREIQVTVRGLYEAVVAALAQVGVAFDPAPDGTNVLDIPNATFMHCWPLPDRNLEEDPATKSGESIWLGTSRYEVMSIRAWGA